MALVNVTYITVHLIGLARKTMPSKSGNKHLNKKRLQTLFFNLHQKWNSQKIAEKGSKILCQLYYPQY